MERLTEEDGSYKEYIGNENIITGVRILNNSLTQKLGQLEDLMEKYNIKTLEQVESAFIGFVTDYTENGRNHIGELLKIEDELGIDLITLFKALLNGIYYKGAYGTNNYGKIVYQEHPPIFFDTMNKLYYFKSTFFDFIYLIQYGKTWALTKEELEKE